VNNAQRKIAAISCWVGAAAIVAAAAGDHRWRGLTLAWLGSFSHRRYSGLNELGGLWIILLVALGVAVLLGERDRALSK